MSYMKRSPCIKYSEKSNKEQEIRKSLSATKFVPFRRQSDTTSESGSDDFKMEMAEDVSSSFSRSSSDSYTFGVNARFQCILKDLTEITHLDEELDADCKQNESLNDFRSRLNSRRKFKTRYQDSQEDDKTDNSCDSTTSKAHEEILRNAQLLKQEQVANVADGYNSKKTFYHREVHYNQKANKPIPSAFQENEETLLNEFNSLMNLGENKMSDYNDDDDDVFQSIQSAAKNKTIARSSTENFLAKNSEDNAKQKSVASPRFRRKTHVLKAASSIPSLIFSNKSFKQKNAPNINNDNSSKNNKNPTNNFEYSVNNTNDKLESLMKKNSIDDDVFNISVTKARRSPLRILGNLVDDKIFRGRWSTAKRAKSTDEITWALANEDNNPLQSDLKSRGGSTKQNRKKSLGNFLTSNNTTDTSQNLFNKKPYKSFTDKFRNSNSDSNSDSFNLNNQNYGTASKAKFIEISKRKPSNTYSEILSPDQNEKQPDALTNHLSAMSNTISNKNEIRAETLAEIEAFEKMLETHLQD